MTLIDSLEALLFVADSPATVEALARAAGVNDGQVEQALEILEARLAEKGSIQLVKIAGGYQLCTKPEYAHLIANFLKPQGHKLSRSLMEVLAIVAYRQPITLAEIDAVRGVQSDYGVHALLDRRLIAEVGRKPTPGRPMLYGTTQQFLHQFKMSDLSQLPEIETDGPDAAEIVADTLYNQG
jgi:segregation and condensation protein B